MTNKLITGEVFGREPEEPRKFLLAEAEKPLSELRGEIEGADKLVLLALEGVSETQARFQPGGEGEEGWSILQVLSHLAGGEGRSARRVRSMALGEEQPPPLTPGTRPNTPPTEGKTLASLMDELKQSQADMLAVADEMTDKDRTDVLARHLTFGELNARGWYRLHGLHAADHARQIERVKLRPGYPKA